MSQLKLALVRVVANLPGKQEEVYNLTVEDCPEYFANGILVHNCDVARFGDDFTAIHVRKGGTSIHHECHNGWRTDQIASRLEALANQYSGIFNRPGPFNPKTGKPLWEAHTGTRHIHARQVPICVDDTGVGGGVTDNLTKTGYSVHGINSQCKLEEPLDLEYPNMRSWLWFGLVNAAQKGYITFIELKKNCPDVIHLLREELIGPTYEMDPRGRRKVESKDDMKARGHRSPDNADAINLAYLSVEAKPDQVVGHVRVPTN